MTDGMITPAVRCELHFLFWFALTENHRERKEKQNDTPGDLKRR
jgi:hypothetical protein